MITRIYADNFRCFSNFEIHPQRMNLLVGDNGSGKSSLLELLEFLSSLSLAPGVLRDHPLRRSFTRWEDRPRQSFQLDLHLDARQYRWNLALQHNKAGDLEVQAETIHIDGALVAELVTGPPARLLLRGKEVPIPYQLDASLLALKVQDEGVSALHRYLGRWSSLNLDIAHVSSISEQANHLLKTDGSNFASFFQTRPRVVSFLQRFDERVQAMIGGLRSLDLEIMGPRAKKLVARLSSGGEHAKSYAVDFGELSPGQRALIILYYTVLAIQLTEQVVTFDEPDNYVGLGELQPWLQLLSRQAEEQKLQVFIASHNPEVIDYLAADTAWLFERDEGGPARVRRLPVDPDSGLKASEQLQRGWTLGA